MWACRTRLRDADIYELRWCCADYPLNFVLPCRSSRCQGSVPRMDARNTDSDGSQAGGASGDAGVDSDVDAPAAAVRRVDTGQSQSVRVLALRARRLAPQDLCGSADPFAAVLCLRPPSEDARKEVVELLSREPEGGDSPPGEAGTTRLSIDGDAARRALDIVLGLAVSGATRAPWTAQTVVTTHARVGGESRPPGPAIHA